MRNTKEHTKRESLQRALLIGGSASILMSLFSPSVLAEEVKSAIDSQKSKEAIETIEVTGVRSSLENALNVKRGASSIVDAISATDMDSLPALDLGEALQALPGIQLNTEDGQRNSEINLRGLKGGFVKTTAEGQSFATPSRSAGAVGGSNPFGSFEATVFDGVTVVKSPTSDMQEGGVAGIVDKKLQRALGKKDGKYSINIGSRYEELSDNWDNQIRFSGSKHIIKNKLAVAWKIAGSEQNFRRDTANFKDYNSLNLISNNTNVDTNFITAEALNDYKALHGINDPLAIVKVVGHAAQVSENNHGDRFSGTGNIEYQATENLKIGANFLYTKRDLGESTMEDVQFSMQTNDRSGQIISQRVTLSDDPNDTPIKLSDNANPNYDPAIHHPDLATIPVYAATVAEISNVSWTPATRLMSYTEEAKGVFLYANYVADDWLIDGTLSKSDSINEFQQTGLDIRHQNKTWATYKDLESGESYKYAPTGLTGIINTGKGDLSKAYARVEGWDSFQYSDVNGILTPLAEEDAWQRHQNGWKTVRLSSNSSALDPNLNPRVPNDYPPGSLPEDPDELQDKIDGLGGRSVEFFTLGRVQRPERDFESGEINFERYTAIGNESFNITSVKFGARHSRELLSTFDVSVGGGGANTSVLNQETIFADALSSANQAEYFNGDYPNHFNADNGWKRIDSENLRELLQTDMVVYDDEGNIVEDFAMADPTGFAVKLDHRTDEPTFGLNTNFRLNFEADQVINAVYLMSNFEGEIGDMTYSGNAGVRYIETTNDVIGQGFDDEGNGIAVLTENDYDHTLPSVNLAVDLTEDVVLRTAYSKGLVRPNLLAQTPSPVYTSSGSSLRLENSKAEVLPYTSTNYDLSLEWYNREGSALSVGVFRKEIEGKIDTRTICPIGDEEYWGVGQLEEVEIGEALPRCQEIEDYVDENGDVVENRRVVVRSTYNSDIPITVTGYELAIQQKLDFLPYPYNGFGGVFNFTKIELDEGDGLPMTNIAPYSYNLIGYYENDGASIRLAYNWQDEKLLSVGGNTSFLGSEARTQTSGGRLDLSASYNFGKGLKVNLQAYNLNDRQEYEYIGGNDQAISRIRYAGRTYSVSLSYNF